MISFRDLAKFRTNEYEMFKASGLVTEVWCTDPEWGISCLSLAKLNLRTRVERSSPIPVHTTSRGEGSNSNRSMRCMQMSHLVALSRSPSSRSMKNIQKLLPRNFRHTLLDRSLRLLALLTEKLLSTHRLRVRVEAEENGLVSEGILLLGEGS